MHRNQLIIFFLHVERAQCTFCRQGNELWPTTIGGGRITWGSDLGRLSWRWGWWLFSVALRWRWRWNPVTAAAFPLCRDTNRCPLPPPVYPLYPVSSFSSTVSLGFPVNIPGFFCFSVSVVSLSTQSVSLSQFPLVFYRFSPPFSPAFGWYL
jgi:hypothetical protein